MLLELGEWLPDQISVRLPGLVSVENAVPTLTGYVGMSEARRIAGLSPLNGVVQGAARGRTQAGISFVVAGTASKLYILQGGDFVDESGAVYALTSGQRWSFALYADTLVAVAPLLTPQRFLFGTDPNFIQLSADASFAKCVMTHNEFVVLGDIIGQGINAAAIGTKEGGLHWCAIGNPNSWPQVSTQAALDVQSDFNVLPGDGGRITDMVSVGEWAVVLRERQTWRMDYVGTPGIFAFRMLDGHRGCTQPGGALSLGGKVYFPSEDGFFVCDGGQPVPIGEEKIDRKWGSMLGTGLISVAHEPQHSLIVWTVPGTDVLIAYQFELGRWTTLRKQVEWLLTTVGGFTSTQLVLDAAPNAAANMDVGPPGLGTTNLDAVAAPTEEERLGAFLPDHALYTFDDLERLTATFETGDYVDPNMVRQLVRSIRPIVTGSDVAFVVSLSGREKPNDPVVYTPLAVNLLGVCPARKAGRFLRAKMQMSGDFYTNGFDADVAPLGDR